MHPKIYFLSKTNYSNSDDRFVDRLPIHGILMSNQLPQISPDFCDDKQATTPMNTDYLVQSCVKSANMCLYATLNNEIHSVMSFSIKQTHVDVDALCVNQVATADETTRKWFNQYGLSGATLLNLLFKILREIGVYMVKLESMPSVRTVNFYRKNKFQDYAPVNMEGLIPMRRDLTPLTLSQQSTTTSYQSPVADIEVPKSPPEQWSLADLDTKNIQSINPPSNTHSTWNIRLRRPIERPSKFNEFTEVGYVSHPTRQIKIPKEQQAYTKRTMGRTKRTVGQTKRTVGRTKRNMGQTKSTVGRTKRIIAIKTKRITKLNNHKTKMSMLKSNRQTKKSKRTAI
jgi:hypothetical protein